jgi:translation initiation factor 2 subunit 1
MARKRGTPSPGELVIYKISRVNPNSAFAVLEEYKKEGMIHISEISSGWVRDIRNHIKAGQTGVAKVLRVEGGHISLSLKRVDKKQENERMREYNLDQRAEKMLEMVAKEFGKTLDDAYELVGFYLQENFGSLHKGFELAIKKPEKLEIEKKWLDVMADIAKKNIEQKEFIFKAKLMIKSYKGDGVNIIKALLKKAAENGLDVRYIAAPEYMVTYKTKEAKKGEREFLSALENIKSPDVEVNYKVLR